MGNELSSGQRTLVGIIKATLHRPRLLVLDEPTASLDPDVALRVRTGLERLCADEGTALLVTSHNMVEVERLCERVVFVVGRPCRRRRHARRGRGPLRSRRPRRRVPAPRRAATAPTSGARRRGPGGVMSWTACSAIARRQAYVLPARAATLVRRGRVAGRRRDPLRRDRRLLRRGSRATGRGERRVPARRASSCSTSCSRPR